MVPACQQCRSGGGTNGRSVEFIVGDALLQDPAQGWRIYFSPKGGWGSETDVVHEHDYDIRGIIRQMPGVFPPFMFAFKNGSANRTGRRRGRKGKHSPGSGRNHLRGARAAIVTGMKKDCSQQAANTKKCQGFHKNQGIRTELGKIKGEIVPMARPKIPNRRSDDLKPMRSIGMDSLNQYGYLGPGCSLLP